MKFQETVDAIAQNNSPVKVLKEMSRPRNQELAAWKIANPGVPVYKFFKAQREKRAKEGGNLPAGLEGLPLEPISSPEQGVEAPVASEPTGAIDPGPEMDHEAEFGGTSGTRSELKTIAAIEEFKAANPEATVEDVVKHLEGLNDQGIDLKTAYITNPKKIEALISKASEPADKEIEGPFVDGPSVEDVEDIAQKRKRKLDAVRVHLAQKIKDPEKRAAYLASHGLGGAKTTTIKPKSSFVTKKAKEDEEDEEPIEIDPDVEKYVGALKGDEDDEG